MTGGWSVPLALQGQIVEVGYRWDETEELLYRRILDRSGGGEWVHWSVLPASMPDDEELSPGAWADEPDWVRDCLWHLVEIEGDTQ